jgi:membrane protein YqaA with SNARE-associated domain
VTIHPVVVLHKINAVLLAALKPLGIWGLGAIALIDSGFMPLPMDPMIIWYVEHEHRKFLFFCLMAAAAAALGSLIPYYAGRAGGELFLLKRINRGRYERMRDRFERQEFVVMMISAMVPPPMPLKVFQFGAGVFEMKPLPYVLAIFLGKLVQFLAFALITIFFGPGVVHAAHDAIHEHPGMLLAIVGAVVIWLLVYILRKMFARRGGTPLPIEETPEMDDTAETGDSTLIT